MKRIVFIISMLAAAASASAAPLSGPYSQIVNTMSRTAYSLDGTWDALVDQYDNGYVSYRMKPHPVEDSFFADLHYYQQKTKLIEYDFDHSDKLQVPGDWNTQMEKLYYYEGSIWYRKVFDFQPKADRRYFAYFSAANYEVVAALNGKMLGKHVGGFTPFNFEVTGQLRETGNSLIVKVNNARHKDAVPTINCDWWNYGGIIRSVSIIETPAVFVRDYLVRLSDDGKSIEGWAQLDGAAEGETVTIEIPELKYKVVAVTDTNGRVSFSRKARPQLWTPADPKLYDVRISTSYETLSDEIGFKTIKVQGSKILLNGEPIFLKGICLHDETMDEKSGRVGTPEQSVRNLEMARELGCNFLRLAHYPHNEYTLRLADKMGFLVWAEIPAYWTISWTNPETYANALNQMSEMIERDRNRACIAIWSVANETPRNADRLKFLSNLIAAVKKLDPTRLVSAAMEKEKLAGNVVTVNDELLQYADLISFNQYVGWYDGDPSSCLEKTWEFPVEKPVIITELGGGALYGYHGTKDERFTEECMEYLYQCQTRMLDRMPYLAGTTPWILKDFRSPRRQLQGIQDDFNRKGLVSEKGEKKLAFEVLKNWYRTK